MRSARLPPSESARAAAAGAAGLCAAALFLLQGLLSPARAQVGVSASLDSDDIWRGVSLTDGRPIASLGVSFDHDSGVYGGLTLSAVDSRPSGLVPQGYVAYLGYARRLAGGGSWEVGVTNSETSAYLEHKYSDNYTELYAGFSKHDISAHIYYSPRNIIVNAPTLYGDVDGAIRPAPGWRLFGHAGVLVSLSGQPPPGGERARFDLRAGVAREFKALELHLAVTATTPRPVYPEGHPQNSSRLEGGVSVFF
jgi:uncharacterized protein (TIGR02001 family)